MQALLGIGVVLMAVADAAAGLRLLWLTQRTGRLPELLLGLALLLLGAVGYPLSVVARRFAGEAGASALLGAALCAQDLACLAVMAFTWRSFRPESQVARALVGLSGLAYAVSLAAPLAGWAPDWDTGWAYDLGFGVRAASFAWGSLESWHTVAQLARRRRIGLGDAVVLDRMRLWGIATAGVFLAFALFGVARALAVDVASSPPVLVATTLAGVSTSIAIWLAFLPPRAYLARVEARARRSPAGS